MHIALISLKVSQKFSITLRKWLRFMSGSLHIGKAGRLYLIFFMNFNPKNCPFLLGFILGFLKERVLEKFMALR